MKDVETFIRTYEQALASQDWTQVAPLIHEDCVATFTEGTYVGKTQVEAAFRRTFDLIKDETYRISDLHWVFQTEAVAVAIYRFHWSGIINGQQACGGGRGTSTLVFRDPDWLLIAEHLGPNAP